METKQIFAQRLKNARVMKGYSMDKLVSVMGNSITKTVISKYEKGQMFPSSSTVIALSKALELPVDYFFRPFTLQIDSIKFRKTKSKLLGKEENAIKEQISDLVERYINVEEVCNSSVKFTQSFKDVVNSESEVKEASKKLRNDWFIGNDGIVNVIDLLEEHGIKVLEIEASESFDGLSSIVNNVYPVVVLNKTYSAERKRFTALHELGHIYLNFGSSITEKQEENYCNLFASEMLIPENTFKGVIGEERHNISYQELKAIQLKFGISCDALMYKARYCGIISEQRAKTYFIQKNTNKAFKELVEKSIYPQEESLRFRSLVYKALSNDFITISKGASLLNQSVEQVRKDLALV